MLLKKGAVILSAKIQLRKCPVIPDTNYLLKLNFTSGYKDSNSWKFLACVFFNSYFLFSLDLGLIFKVWAFSGVSILIRFTSVRAAHT